MTVDMSDYTDYDEGSFGYEVERIRREGYAIADEVERDGSAFAAALIRDDFRRGTEELLRRMAEARDDTLRQWGIIP